MPRRVFSLACNSGAGYENAFKLSPGDVEPGSAIAAAAGGTGRAVSSIGNGLPTVVVSPDGTAAILSSDPMLDTLTGLVCVT